MAGYDSVDWKRYHELLDIQSEREFAPTERVEYEKFLPILAELDEAELARLKPITDKAKGKHEETIASLKGLLKKLTK